MIQITKEEAEQIRKRFPDVPITRTMRQSGKRGKRYVEESRHVLSFLKYLREKNVIEHYE